MMPDTSLTAMHSQLVAVQTEYAAEKVHYGAQWPHIKALKSQMDELNREIQAEVKSDALRLKDEYAASQKTEVALRGEMDRQKGQALDSNKKYIEFEILKREAENSRGLYEGLFRKLQEAGITAGLKSDNVEVVDYAFPTAQPSDPDVKRMMAFGLVAGILFGALIAFVRESLADTIETIEEAELISNLPSIGVIPPIRQTSGTSGDKQDVTGRSSQEAAMHAHADPRSKVAEAFRSLRTAVLLSSGGKGKIKVVAVTSASQGEGKSTTCSNLAIVMAQAGAKVLLIDADMRLGKLRQKHDNNKGSGLSEVLSGIASLEDSIAPSNSVDNLSLLFAGTPPPFPSELLASGMQDLLEKCRAKFDFVLVDTPPILAVTDPIIVSTITDRTILVVRPTRTGKRALLRAKTVLESSGIRTLGVVVNAMNIERDSYYSNAYYYGDNANDVYYKGASSDKR
jgi:capsular exopolysaccharide synthesis family protein